MQLRLIAARSLALAAFGLAVLFASCGGGDSGPDLIYYNGVVLTMDADSTEATSEEDDVSPLARVMIRPAVGDHGDSGEWKKAA